MSKYSNSPVEFMKNVSFGVGVTKGVTCGAYVTAFTVPDNEIWGFNVVRVTVQGSAQFGKVGFYDPDEDEWLTFGEVSPTAAANYVHEFQNLIWLEAGQSIGVYGDSGGTFDVYAWIEKRKI